MYNHDELNNALYRAALVLDKGLESTRELVAGYKDDVSLMVISDEKIFRIDS